MKEKKPEVKIVDVGPMKKFYLQGLGNYYIYETIKEGNLTATQEDLLRKKGYGYSIDEARKFISGDEFEKEIFERLLMDAENLASLGVKMLCEADPEGVLANGYTDIYLEASYVKVDDSGATRVIPCIGLPSLDDVIEILPNLSFNFPQTKDTEEGKAWERLRAELEEK